MPTHPLLTSFSLALQKLSAEAQKKPAAEKKFSLLKALKNSAIVAGGFGAGYVGGGLVDMGLQAAFGDAWSRVQPSTKLRLLAPAVGVAAGGAALTNLYLAAKRHEADRE
jgi:hypothetical protein